MVGEKGRRKNSAGRRRGTATPRRAEGAGAGRTWSVHQYQRDGMVIPIRIPGHGRSEVSGSLKI